jgi:hypothetical protein
MRYLKQIVLWFSVFMIVGCSERSWTEVQLEVNTPNLFQVKDLKAYPEFSINNVVFCLNVGVQFDEPGFPFCIKLSALSKCDDTHTITLETVTALSVSGHQYHLISEDKLPLQIKLDSQVSSSLDLWSVYSFEFDGRLGSSLEKGEEITLDMLLNVDGVEGELTYTLVPVVKKFVMDDSVKGTPLNVRQVE